MNTNKVISQFCGETFKVSAILFKLVVFVVAISLLSPASVVRAGTLTVTNANDSGEGSLRQAIIDATTGDVIDFSGDFTIVTAGFYINKQLTIDGTGHNVTISGNHLNKIFNFDVGTGNAWLTNLTISNGMDISSAGAIWTAASHLYVTNCTFSGNTSPQGGAISVGSGRQLVVTGSTFVGNSATGLYGDGGAIYASGGALVTNSTFKDNSAGRYGGALYNVTTITNSTIAGNTATTSGGGVYNTAAKIAINSIIANNTGGNCGGTAYGGTSTNNLSSDGTCSGGFTQSSSILLGTLGSYGGATQTIPLLPNSDAIDTGYADSCPTLDQRGASRVGTCDIGAFESGGFTLGSQSGTPQSTAIDTDFANPLELTVTANVTGEPVSGGTVTFVGPSSGASTNPATNVAVIAVDGTLSQSVTANGVSGGPYNVTASARGVATGLTYELTNTSTSYLYIYVPIVLKK